MSKLILITFVAVVVATVLANDCKYNDATIKNGEDHLPIGECIRISCNDGEVSALPCPLYGMPAGCKVKYQALDLTKAYPSCCAKAYCDSE